MYIYIYVEREMCVYIYIYISVHIYIYIYIHTLHIACTYYTTSMAASRSEARRAACNIR